MMNKNNFLEKLLDGIEVEWKKLGEILIRTKGTKITASKMKELHKENSPVKIFAGGKTIAFVNFNDIPEKDINKEKSIIVKSRGKIEFEYYDQPFSHKNEMWSYHSKNKEIDIKYIYYFLKLHEKYFQSLGNKMQMPQISIPDTDNFLIPIIPIENQKYITSILDKFSLLTAELTARKKQYNYYLNKLFNFTDREVEWKCLGEVGKLIRGNGLQKKDFQETGFPAIHYGQIFTKYGLSANKTFTYISKQLSEKLKIADTNSLLIATTSENDKDVLKALAWTGSKVAISGDMMFFKHNQNVKYLAYYFQTEYFQQQKNKYITGTKVRRVSKDNLEKIFIPIPPLSEQKRIVAILDKFDTLVHSISEGLPKEIELRQQQYEYYREMLLNFPKPE